MDYDKIEALVAVLRDSAQLTEVEIRSGETVLTLRRPASSIGTRTKRGGAGRPRQMQNGTGEKAPAPDLPGGPKSEPVTATVVGIFHAARKPVEVGDAVLEGQVLGQIETMRLMNDSLAPVTGRIQAVLVQDSQPVEYGQPLFEIVPEVTE